MQIEHGKLANGADVAAAVSSGELRRIPLRGRPTSMPATQLGEVIVGSLTVAGEFTRLFYCLTFDDVTAVYDAYDNGGGSGIEWFGAPDPRETVITYIPPDHDLEKGVEHHFDLVERRAEPDWTIGDLDR